MGRSLGAKITKSNQPSPDSSQLGIVSAEAHANLSHILLSVESHLSAPYALLQQITSVKSW